MRELQNAVERAVILSRGGKLALELPQNAGSLKKRSERTAGSSLHGDAIIPEKEWRERERANILTALRQANFRISGKGGAAELLGINAGTLASRLKAMGIEKRDHIGFRTT